MTAQKQESTSLLSLIGNKETNNPLPSQLDLFYHLYSFMNDYIAGNSAE